MEGEDKVNQDNLIQAQKDALEKEIANTIPLIGEKETLQSLVNEYQNDEVSNLKLFHFLSHLNDNYSIRFTLRK